MTVNLRPHHLLCMLTHIGKGYSPDFTANMAVILKRIAAGEMVEIVDGPDDICAPLCTGLAGRLAHCHRKSIAERDRAAADDVGRLLSIAVRPGTRLTLDTAMIQDLRTAFAQKRIRSACEGCEWSPLCDSVAASGYADTCL